MAIDRIGKGGTPPTGPEGGTPPATGVAKTGRPFEVKPATASEAPAAVDVQKVGPTPLERLRAGDIDVDTYVDLKLDEATAHLHGLRPAELDMIRKTLRDQVATDPALVDLVTRATGAAPRAPRDE
jgi:hypothetical protein